MKFPRWIGARLWSQGRKGDSHDDVYQVLQQAHAHLLLEEYDKARTLLLRVIGFRDSINDPETISYVLMSVGSTWLLTERYEDGVAFFSEYLRRYPEDSAAYRGRADALWYVGRFQEAIRDYTRALELKPNDILSLSGRGQVLAELGENRQAMEDLNSALLTLKAVPMPNSSWAKWYEEIEAFVHNGRGFALAGLGESEPAFSEFELSISLSPDNAWVYHNRAQVYDRAGSREKATLDYEKALTKTKPPLNPVRKEHAHARVRELSNRQ